MMAGAGLSRLFSDDSRNVSSDISAADPDLLSRAEIAVRLAPADPEAHRTRAIALSALGQTADALPDYERACSLRPQDYLLWTDLGYTRDTLNDVEGALTAYREAIRLAPYYAQPRYYLGALLLRTGQRDEGFAELNRATTSDLKLINSKIRLAWNVYEGDVAVIERVVQPQTDAERLLLARFLVKQGKSDDAMRLFRSAGGLTQEDRNDLLKDLLAAKNYAKAYEVWKEDRAGNSSQMGNAISDAGFESGEDFSDAGFSWRKVGNEPNVQLSLDRSDPREGKRSLRFDFKGEIKPGTSLISQLVLVAPGTRYRLNFAARTQELVSGGLPLIAVFEAGAKDKSLAQSKPLPQGTNGWQNLTLEFAAPSGAQAVNIALQREGCKSRTCPMFGRLWLDNFSLEKL